LTVHAWGRKGRDYQLRDRRESVETWHRGKLLEVSDLVGCFPRLVRAERNPVRLITGQEIGSFERGDIELHVLRSREKERERPLKPDNPPEERELDEVNATLL
jgi:hypothetical protein